MIEKQTRKSIKHLKIDNELKFYSDEFNQFCNERGIVRYCTIVRTPQQNGIAEWMNRVLLERAQNMLSNVGLGKEFQAEACNIVVFLINKSPLTHQLSA